MKASVYAIPVLALLAASAFLVAFSGYEKQTGVQIQDKFDGKIVYTTDTSKDPAPYEADCASRKGTFSSCGSVCKPGARICVQVCAYTCELARSQAIQGNE